VDFVDALKVLARRWYVVFGGLVLLAFASMGAILYVPTNYQASAQYLLLLPSDSTGIATPTNPLINLPSGLSVVATLIAGDMMTKEQMRDMVDSGFQSSYAIALTPGSGPLLDITSDDTDAAEAVRTRDELIRRLDDDLRRIQDEAGAPKNQTITASTYAVGRVAEAVPGAKIKALAGIEALGLTLTLVITFTIDRMVLAGKAKRADKPKRQRKGSKNEIDTVGA